MEKITRKTIEQVGGRGLVDQLQVSVRVLDQRDKLPPHIVTYHENIISYWATFFSLWKNPVGAEIRKDTVLL